VRLPELVADADRRRVTDAIRTALTHPDPVARRAAARALARIHAPAEARLLQRALRDTDPEVRRWASLGLGALERDAPEGTARSLALALAAEPDPETRGALIRDLARLPGDEALPALEASLRSEHPPERAGACAAAGELGVVGRSVPSTVRSRVAALLGPTEEPAVRLACAFALARLPAPSEDAQAERVALTLATADPDPEVRVLAYRALGRQPAAELDALVHGTRDEDWRVAAQAYRALAARAADVESGTVAVRAYAGALDAAYQRAVAEGDVAPGGPLHLLLTALEAAGPFARSAPIADFANRLLRQLGAPAGPEVPVTRDRGLAHCAAAELVDRARGWPSRIETCGLEQVLPRERRVRAAAILADLEGAEAARVALLARMVRDPEPAVREAALTAAARIWHPDATALVLRALRETDPGVLAAAAEALTTIAGRAPTDTAIPPPLDSAAALAALRAASAHLDDGELETLVTWLGAVDAVDARALLPRVQALALHPSHAVRDRARAILAGWQAALPSDPVPEPPRPVEPSSLLPSDERPRVTLHTDRGELVIELRPDVAPVTALRFLELVRAGTYDGLTFHRVVPGFVAQGGDPRGDGYGGPGFWQRCEDSRLPYVRGTVGMALAGRDTGGSQFFITHAAQPHLEARYTAFGQVVEGLDVLDRIQVGDRIRSAQAVP
jgi:cyclophilin family peptidyl-prolyl cis-trans isomerase/HEAT repeat protein